MKIKLPIEKVDMKALPMEEEMNVKIQRIYKPPQRERP